VLHVAAKSLVIVRTLDTPVLAEDSSRKTVSPRYRPLMLA
jgi:hypothetical protein